MIKRLPLFLILLTSQLLLSQQSDIVISGSVKNYSQNGIKDVHIINLNTKAGTVTNANGQFELAVSIGDSLRFSNIQYQNMKIYIIPKISREKKVVVYLFDKTNQLDEVFVKRKMVGILGIDLKKTPVDRRAEALRKIMDFSKIDMTIQEADDHIDKRVRPPAVNTDPVGNFGASAKAVIPFKDSERMWALRRKLEYKKRFPAEVKAAFGDNFFFKQLKIPKERFHHFLEYCNPLGIEDLYQNNKILEVIKIFRKESISYRKLIEKNN